MKWYRAPAVLICSLNSMMAALVLSLAAFYSWTDNSTNPPTSPNKEWIHLVANLIPFSATWMIISLAGIFVSMARHQIYLTTMVLVFYSIIFGISIYFTVAFENQLEMEDVKAEVLFNETVMEINSQKSKLWIPEWLDNIQRKSKQCCGVVTYRDYELFWPYASTKFPRSCCRVSKDLDDVCPTDLNHIPFPNTPDTYIKVEAGCTDEINDVTRRRIQESYTLSVIMSGFLCCAVIALLIVYVRIYILGGSSSRSLRKKRNNGGGDEYLGGGSDNAIIENGVIVMISTGQIASSLNSMDAKPLSPVESVVDQDGKLAPLTSDPLKQVPPTAAVFPGLHQQFPDASTGDDMTIGGGSMGRKEVFIAQDTTDNEADPKTKPIQEPWLMPIISPQKINSASPLNDVEGDVVHIDPEPNFHQEKEKKKKRKGRNKLFILQDRNQ